MNKNYITTIVVVVVVGALAFFGGIKYQQSKAPAVGQFRQRFGNRNTRPIRGDIVSVDANSATVKLQDGSSKIIILSSSTMFVKSENATKDDLKTGSTVVVFGTQNSDGSITAQNVQLNPQQMRLGRPQPTGK